MILKGQLDNVAVFDGCVCFVLVHVLQHGVVLGQRWVSDVDLLAELKVGDGEFEVVDENDGVALDDGLVLVVI